MSADEKKLEGAPSGDGGNHAPVKRALLIEDHDSSREMMARLLANRKFIVSQASSGQEAWTYASTETFDLIISDIGLPDTDGFELMKKLKAVQTCPSIALSGYGGREDIAKSRASGFEYHLTKPVLSQSLDEALKHLAESRRSSSS